MQSWFNLSMINELVFNSYSKFINKLIGVCRVRKPGNIFLEAPRPERLTSKIHVINKLIGFWSDAQNRNYGPEDTKAENRNVLIH